MATDVYFTESDYPDLMTTPLRGVLLKEFVDYVRGGANIGVTITPSKNLNRPLPLQICDEITAALDTVIAQKYGIDLNDLNGIIRRVTSQNPNTLPNDLESFFEVCRSLPDQSEGNIRTALAQMLIPDIMSVFSMCLAVQEGKEKELLTLSQKKDRENIEAATRLMPRRSQDQNLPNALVNMLFTNEVVFDCTLEAAVRRNSPIVSIMERMGYGGNYPQTRRKEGKHELTNHAIVTAMDLNKGSIATKQVVIPIIRKNLMDAIQRTFGISPREID